MVIYFEVDSVLPQIEIFDFLKKYKFRIRTIKLRGQVSQGLVFPVSVLLPEYGKWQEGEDVTELLGVKKYDPEGELENVLNAAGKWPEFITRTDETRIQNFPNICQDYESVVFDCTEKLDGQSATYFLKREYNKNSFIRFFQKLFGIKKYIFGVCSRKVYLKNETENNYWRMAKKYDIEKVLRSLIGKREYVYIQGEIIGEGIQGNKYKIHGQEFHAFNLVSEEGRATTFGMILALKHRGIKLVPLLGKVLLPATIDECVSMSVGESVLFPRQREGLVLRNYEMGISFKIINPEFLLEHGL